MRNVGHLEEEKQAKTCWGDRGSTYEFTYICTPKPMAHISSQDILSLRMDFGNAPDSHRMYFSKLLMKAHQGVLALAKSIPRFENEVSGDSGWLHPVASGSSTVWVRRRHLISMRRTTSARLLSQLHRALQQLTCI